MGNLEKKVLPNGLRVLFYRIPGARTCAIFLEMGVGSRYEAKGQRGISHMFEHMVFRGTAKRPSQLLLDRELEGMGGGWNAGTGEEDTEFYLKVPKEHFPSAFEIFADLILNARLSEEDLEKEKGALGVEHKEDREDYEELVAGAFDELFFGSHPLSWDIAGTEETVSRLSCQDLRDHKEGWLKPKNLVLAVVGDLKKDEVFSLAEKYWAGLPDKPWGGFAPFVFRQKRPQVRIEGKRTEIAYFILGFKSLPRGSSGEFPALLLSAVLGIGSGSRLFWQLRGERGLVYGVSAEVKQFADIGQFLINGEVEPVRFAEAIGAILEELTKIKSSPVREEELRRAKNYLKGGQLGLMEDPISLARSLAEQELLRGSVVPLREIPERIEKVSAGEVLQAAREIFVPSSLNLAVVGPFGKKDKRRFLKILRLGLE